MTIRFSVVIPLYNKRAYIRRAVDSVLAQTHRDFELIVVDDGSTDGSDSALAALGDDRCRISRQANAGEGAARNRGAAEAREAWVSFLDADDFWLPGHLGETAKIIEAFREATFVATGYREIRDVHVAGLGPFAERAANIRRIDYFLEASRKIGRVNASNVTIRRSALLEIGGFGAFRAGADLDCWARLALEGFAALSDRVTSIYVRGNGGAMQQLQDARPITKAPAVAVPGLLDISPSVASLCRAFETAPALAGQRGVHLYLNARVYACLYGALYDANVAAARNYAKLLTPPYGREIAMVRAVLGLPAGWLTATLKWIRRIKDARRGFISAPFRVS